MERLTFLVDSNIFLEGLLEQEKSNQVNSFLKGNKLNTISISDLALFSIGIILSKLKKKDVFTFFLNDLIIEWIEVLSLGKPALKEVIDNSNKFNLDFDDAYQYTIAKNYDLKLVSFDKDFDKTDIKRLEL